MTKSRVSNTRHTRWDGDGGEAAAIIESRVSNRSHIRGNDRRGTTNNQCVAACFNNSIAVITRIIFCIFFCYYHGSEAVASRESRVPNTRYTRWDGDGGEAAATIES